MEQSLSVTQFVDISGGIAILLFLVLLMGNYKRALDVVGNVFIMLLIVAAPFYGDQRHDCFDERLPRDVVAVVSTFDVLLYYCVVVAMIIRDSATATKLDDYLSRALCCTMFVLFARDMVSLYADGASCELYMHCAVIAGCSLGLLVCAVMGRRPGETTGRKQRAHEPLDACAEALDPGRETVDSVF